MRESGNTGTHQRFAKRVSVRSGGAGHAHSGVVMCGIALATAGEVGDASLEKRAKSPKTANGKFVKLGT